MKTEAKTPGDKVDAALKKVDDKVNELKEMGIKAKDKVVEVVDTGVEKAKEFGEKMDENVHARPYHYIAGAAVAGFVIGFLISRK